MEHTTLATTTDAQAAEQRPPLSSISLFATEWVFGWPILLILGGPSNGYPWISAAFLVACALWVVVDLVVYLARHNALPPWPVWAKFNRWTVPLYFAVSAFSAARIF